MKIVHFCLSCFYIDNFAYQENELVAQNVADGHDVVVIASTETYGDDGRLHYLSPGTYIGSDGARVIRLPYRQFLPHFAMRKLRMHPYVYKLLITEDPDTILFHGLCGWELITVARYVKTHPAVKLYVDSHEDFNNSARTIISKYLLHLCYYRWIVRKSLPSIDTILCISVDTITFVRHVYGVSAKNIELFPLGGSIVSDAEYAETRSRIRKSHSLQTDHLVFIQSGKIDYSKKLLEALGAFSSLGNPNLVFFVVGYLHHEVKDQVFAFMRRDSRIRFLGWKTPSQLRELLCAADIYVQPGTQSATMQMSLCCRCIAILDDVPSHKLFINDNGWLVGKKLSLNEAFSLASQNHHRLDHMSNKSFKVATRMLDYKVLAARLYI
jgi:glycosyltransferase involved in cell wall biosynthesis